MRAVGTIKRRRDHRLAQPNRMRLTERDRQIIEAVHRFRVLRQDQVQSLFFGGKSTAQRALARLYDHGFLERKFVPVIYGRSPTLYVLDRRGAELLRAERGYDELVWYPSSRELKSDFLEHTCAINDVRVAVTVAAREQGYDLFTWQSEADMKSDYDRVSLRTSSGKTQIMPIVPDSYFALATPRGRTHFFLEVDRGTETSERFKTKVRAFLAYYTSGGYERRFGTRSLRVLTVVPGARRLANLKAVTEAAGGERSFWFALSTSVTAQTILDQSVWSVAGEVEQKPLIVPSAGQNHPVDSGGVAH